MFTTAAAVVLGLFVFGLLPALIYVFEVTIGWVIVIGVVLLILIGIASNPGEGAAFILGGGFLFAVFCLIAHGVVGNSRFKDPRFQHLNQDRDP